MELLLMQGLRWARWSRTSDWGAISTSVSGWVHVLAMDHVMEGLAGGQWLGKLTVLLVHKLLVHVLELAWLMDHWRSTNWSRSTKWWRRAMEGLGRLAGETDRWNRVPRLLLTGERVIMVTLVRITRVDKGRDLTWPKPWTAVVEPRVIVVVGHCEDGGVNEDEMEKEMSIPPSRFLLFIGS